MVFPGSLHVTVYVAPGLCSAESGGASYESTDCRLVSSGYQSSCLGGGEELRCEDERQVLPSVAGLLVSTGESNFLGLIPEELWNSTTTVSTAATSELCCTLR